MKRFFRHLFILFFLCSLCYPGGAGQAKTEPKPGKIVAMLDIMVRRENGQQQLIDRYQKLTGIELRIIQPPHNQYFEKLVVAFSAGEIPDLVQLPPDYYLQFAAEGAILPLDSYIAKSAVCQKIDPANFNALRLRDGKVYGFPINAGGGTVTYLRKDWLDNVGLAPPKTWAELYAVMKAFTYGDPDRNGRDDTVGYTLPGVGEGIYLRDFYQDTSDEFIFRNGKWVDGFTQPNFRQALIRLRQAYQERLLDKEIFTNKTSTIREKIYAGKAGIINYWSGPWAKVLDENVKANCGPKAELIPIPAIQGSFYYNRVPPVLAITRNCKNPAGVFKWFMELMYDGGPGQMLFTHGVDGVHWVKRKDGYQKLAAQANTAQTFGKTFIQPDLSLVRWQDPFRLDPKVALSRNLNDAAMRQQLLFPLSESYLKTGGEIGALKEEIVVKVMLGQYTADEGLRIYREQGAKLGLDKILAEFNQ